MDGMNFFSDEDLSDVLSQLDDASKKEGDVSSDDSEMAASQRRFEEIIKKHRGEGKGNQ